MQFLWNLNVANHNVVLYYFTTVERYEILVEAWHALNICMLHNGCPIEGMLRISRQGGIKENEWYDLAEKLGKKPTEPYPATATTTRWGGW